MVKSLPKPEAAGFGGKSGDLGFDVVRKDEYFRFRDCPRLPFELNSLPQIASCGIFVCGAGTAGARHKYSLCLLYLICKSFQLLLADLLRIARQLLQNFFQQYRLCHYLPPSMLFSMLSFICLAASFGSLCEDAL